MTNPNTTSPTNDASSVPPMPVGAVDAAAGHGITTEHVEHAWVLLHTPTGNWHPSLMRAMTTRPGDLLNATLHLTDLLAAHGVAEFDLLCDHEQIPYGVAVVTDDNLAGVVRELDRLPADLDLSGELLALSIAARLVSMAEPAPVTMAEVDALLRRAARTPGLDGYDVVQAAAGHMGVLIAWMDAEAVQGKLGVTFTEDQARQWHAWVQADPGALDEVVITEDAAASDALGDWLREQVQQAGIPLDGDGSEEDAGGEDESTEG